MDAARRSRTQRRSLRRALALAVVAAFALSAAAGQAVPVEPLPDAPPPPGYDLQAPPTVAPFERFLVDLGDEGRDGDVLVMAWLEEAPPDPWAGGGSGALLDPGAAAPLLDPLAALPEPPVETDVAGRWQVEETAPELPGVYELRVVDAFGAVLDRTELVVEGEASATVDACPSPPDEAALRDAFEHAVDTFLAAARLAYGWRYQGFSYDLRITSVDVRGERGTVEASYDGSATDGATGQEVAARGTISARFTWERCAWSLDGYSY